MRKLIILVAIAELFTLIVSVRSHAQDIIVKRDSTTVEALVDEITDDKISYRRADNPTGPKYTVSIAKVARIIYENGVEDVFPEVEPEAQPVQPVVEPYNYQVVPEPRQDYSYQGTNEVAPQPYQPQQAEPQAAEPASPKKKKSGGFSMGVLAATEATTPEELLSTKPDLFNAVQAYADIYFASWIFAGVSGSYSPQRIKGWDVNRVPYSDRVMTNIHLGLQIPFNKSSRVFGIGVYGGPTMMFLKESSSSSFDSSPTWGWTAGVRFKGIFCITAEYHAPGASAYNIPNYFSVGVGLGF